jgi:hypothetical protein
MFRFTEKAKAITLELGAHMHRHILPQALSYSPLEEDRVVSLQRAGKYQSLPGDRHKGKNAELRGLSWHLSGPLTPGDAFDAGRADARRRLRSSPLAASHHSCGLTPLLAGAMAGRERAAPHATSRHGR